MPRRRRLDGPEVRIRLTPRSSAGWLLELNNADGSKRLERSLTGVQGCDELVVASQLIIERALRELGPVSITPAPSQGSPRSLTISWLYQIISHEVSAHLRKGRVRAFSTGRWALDADHEASSPEGAVSARRALSDVEQVLAKLSLKKREVFVLFELEGLAHEEIAEMVRCPTETVRTRLHAARREFEAIARKRGVWP